MRRKSFNIHERFLRHIWSNQYLNNNMQTTDGRIIRVINVGQINPDGGPDFRNAKIKIGSVTYIGDVEIHRTVFDWIQHQHQEDPKYNSVILHVVLEVDGTIPTVVKSGRQVPVLVLSKYLSDSIHTIWQRAILDERAKKDDKIRCYEKNSTVKAEIIERYLEKLAVERLEIKLRRFEERLKELAQEKRMQIREHQQGYIKDLSDDEISEIPPPAPDLKQKDFTHKELWEQIMYEGVMEGLGYSKNREPFVRLSKNLTLKAIKELKLFDSIKIQSILFGISGLIPRKLKDIKDEESRKFIQQIKNGWKELKPYYHGEILNEAGWQFFPTRPTNFPTIRIAAAIEIIMKFLNNDLFRKVIQTIKSSETAKSKEENLLSIFSIDTNIYWKTHYHFEQKTSKQICALGKERIYEIIINTILPVALLYARIFKDRAVREGVLSVYKELPKPTNNSITKLMERQLLKSRIKSDSVCKNQALIQLYKYYCIENRCSDCEIGRKIFKS